MKTARRRAQVGLRFSTGRRSRDPVGRLQRLIHACARAVTVFARTVAGKRCRRREQMRQPLAFALVRRWGIRNPSRQAAAAPRLPQRMIAAPRRRSAMPALPQHIVAVPARGSRLDLPMARSLARGEPLAPPRAGDAGSVVRLPRAANRYHAHVAALARAGARHTARPAEPSTWRRAVQALGRWRDRAGPSSPSILQLHRAKNLERADRRVERSSRVFVAGTSPSLLPHRTNRSSVTDQDRRTVRQMDRMPARAPTHGLTKVTTARPPGAIGTRQPHLPSRFGVHVRDAPAPPFSAPRLPASRRSWRAERPVQPIALAIARPRSRGAESHGAFPAVEAVLKPPQRQAATASGASLAEVENAIIARIDKTIEKRIVAVVKQTIGSDAEYSRTADRVYGSLYDRLILEKERLG